MVSKKILLCFGTRPEAIKMAILIKKLKKENFDVGVCVTAQHRQMLDQVLTFFNIIPDFDLNLMCQNQTLNKLSSKIFDKIDEVLENFKPDLVLVHGDTTTSSISAFAAFHRKIKVGHIEAGLRTYNKNSPFPEELNRQVTGRISDYHFSPTELSKSNLLKEGISEKTIIVTGNTVVDSLLWSIDKIEKNKGFNMHSSLNKVDFTKRIVLVTGHRRENFGEGVKNICNSLIEISKENDCEIIYPVHLNPNIKEPVLKLLSNKSGIHLIEPLDYENFIWLLKKSYLIITDSGGIQEEAPTIGLPVLVTRDTTERPEAVAAGCVKLVGTNSAQIIIEANNILNNQKVYNEMNKCVNPYGDGEACDKIIEFLKENL